MYAKACPDVTYVQLEEAFRTQKVAIWLIAIEKELSATYTNMDLQGNLGKKHSISWRWSDKPRAPKEMDIWPATPDENLERLADAGQPIDCKMPKCSNCDALGHTQVCPYVIYPFEVIYSWTSEILPRGEDGEGPCIRFLLQLWRDWSSCSRLYLTSSLFFVASANYTQAQRLVLTSSPAVTARNLAIGKTSTTAAACLC